MGGEIASGLFALGGAAIGGLASWVAAATELRGSSGEAKRQRRDAMSDTRRLLYTDLIKRADLLADGIRDLYSYSDPAEVPATNRKRYLAAWEDYVQASAAVEVVGPSDMAMAARQLYRALADMSNQIDSWLRDRARWTEEDDATFVAHQERKTSERASFLKSAQLALDAAK